MVYPPQVTVGGTRPAVLKIPRAYDGSAPLPLVVFLHGYTSSAASHDSWWQVSARVDVDQFFLLLPDGTRELSSASYRFWNATQACCNRYGSDVDDVAYLLDLLDEVGGRFAVDSSRVYLIGHSNGGFMSHRLACEAAHRIAAIAELAGATLLNEADCEASGPVSVLHVHGDADSVVYFAGNPSQGVYPQCPQGYPGAQETARRWAERAGCTLGAAHNDPPIDIEPMVSGAETSVLRYSAGCAAGIEVELWTIVGGQHSPRLPSDWAERLVGWLLDHPRP